MHSISRNWEGDERMADQPLYLVSVAASAGGLRALKTLLSCLSPDLPAAVAVVQHMAPWFKSQLPSILERETKLLVKEAEEGDLLMPSRVYIAPPNRHLLINPDNTLSLSYSELVHFLRPSADLLFESAAASFKERAIAVVLTGTGVDGAMGVRAIKKMGGRVIVQRRDQAEFSGMPEAAVETGSADYELSLEEIAGALAELTKGGGTP